MIQTKLTAPVCQSHRLQFPVPFDCRHLRVRSTTVRDVYQRRATTTPLGRASTACNRPTRSTAVYVARHHLLVDDYARPTTIGWVDRL